MAKKIKCTHQRCKWTNNKGIFSTHTDNRPVGESFSFLVRPETISELIEAASGSRRSAQEWTRSMRRSMKEAVRNGKIKARSSSMLAGRERWIFLVIHEFPKGPSQISWYLEIFVSASYSHYPGIKDSHVFCFSIVRIVISVSNVTSLQVYKDK